MKKIALKNAARGTAFDYAGQSWILLENDDGEVVAVALVKGPGLDDVLAQAEGTAVIILQQDPALAGIVEGLSLIHISTRTSSPTRSSPTTSPARCRTAIAPSTTCWPCSRC